MENIEKRFNQLGFVLFFLVERVDLRGFLALVFDVFFFVVILLYKLIIKGLNTNFINYLLILVS